MSVLQNPVCVELKASARTRQEALAVNASKDSAWTLVAYTVKVMLITYVCGSDTLFTVSSTFCLDKLSHNLNKRQKYRKH